MLNEEVARIFERDACSTAQLDWIRYGVFQARRAWVEPHSRSQYLELDEIVPLAEATRGSRGVGGFMIKTFFAVIVVSNLALAQEPVPASMTVTVEATRGKQVPELKREDVMVYQAKQRLTVTEWAALKGEQAGLALYILIDDASASSLGNQLSGLRDFINAQPTSSRIGVGFMHNGIADIKQDLTSDHEKSAAALRLPLGRIATGTSPYLSLSDLIKKWPTCCVRREVLFISSGVDPLGGLGPANPYVDTAVAQAQRAGVIVYTIYTLGVGHTGHSFWRMSWGQNHLAQLAEETGGESYMLGFGPPVSFAPYLKDLAERFTHQYSVSFLIKPRAKPGLVTVRLATEVPGAEIVAAPKVFVGPAPQPSSGH